MLLLIFLTANSFIKCCNYEVFTNFVWPLNFHYEKQQRGGLRGGAEWDKARSTPRFKCSKSKNNMFLTLALIRDRAPFYVPAKGPKQL